LPFDHVNTSRADVAWRFATLLRALELGKINSLKESFDNRSERDASMVFRNIVFA
jgi:hypothetical protein